MNKKSKQSRLKHRKNKERMRNLLQASRLKAKPKKAAITPEKEAPIQNMVEEVAKPEAVKKAAKPAKKKTAAKKTAAKKKTTAKKPAKKASVKKTSTKKKAAIKKPATKKKSK